jgi:flagellar biosynthetic protein FliQ
MLEQNIIDLTATAIMSVISVAIPPLLVGLAVGLVVAIFQAVTSIQEQTLAFIPKILAVFTAIMFAGSYMIQILTNFIEGAFDMIPILVAL